MPQTLSKHPRAARRVLFARSGLCATHFLAITALLSAVWTSAAQAQSWSSPHTRPLLRQLVSVDASGEANWPYGSEDIARDGLPAFADDEAGSDLRSVYADADSQRIWLRAYVAGESQPPASLVAFFFADTDDRDSTGGPAFGAPLSPAWNSDPTPGGYERAIGMRGDGTLIDVWRWDSNDRVWIPLAPDEDDARVEVGRDEDPLRIGAFQHGYVQVDVLHTLSGLTASCEGNLFVRTWHAEAAPRAFGDDDAQVFECRPAVDIYGDPIVIRSVRCQRDRDCPNNGRCRERVCLFAHPCSADRDCRSDERCTDNACIRLVTDSCLDNTDCRGLVCQNGACVACTDNGARACSRDLACSPNGTCVNANGNLPGIVRGGAFHCAVRAANERSLGAWLWGLAGAWLLRRRTRREGRAS